MHINKLNRSDLEQEVAQASKQADLAYALGNKKAMKKWLAYKDACFKRLNEIDPIQEVEDDELMAALFTA